MKTLTIYIPTYERYDECLVQVNKLTDYIEKLDSNDLWLKVIVANNNSKDERYESFKCNNIDSFTYIKRERNLGISGAIIEGFRMLDTDYIWILSDDDIVDVHVLDEIKAVINKQSPKHIYIKCDVSGDDRVKRNEILEGGEVFSKFSALSMFGFISTNIYSADIAEEIESGYLNASSYFPHVAILFSYISRNYEYNCSILSKDEGYFVQWVSGKASYGSTLANTNVYIGMLRLSSLIDVRFRKDFIKLLNKDYGQSHYIPISLNSIKIFYQVITKLGLYNYCESLFIVLARRAFNKFRE